MSRARSVALVVNGRERAVEVAPDTSLLYVLRNDLGLVGTRFGCGEQTCGSCHVLVDGAVVASCGTPVDAVEGRLVTTVENQEDARLDALRRAFVAEQAAQCGACSSGILITASALLADEPAPDDAAVRAALDGNLCRCGAHPRIVRAVLRAARELAHG